MRRPQLILSLCDYTGNWARPYLEADYEVVTVDLKHGQDVRLMKLPTVGVHGILAAPPCTVFANSGARWPRTDDDMREGLSIVDACCRIILAAKPKWWALENPVGKLKRYLGDPAFMFHPNEFGGWNNGADAYTKRTCLWGEFNLPKRRPVPPLEGSKMHLVPPSPERNAIRSETPMGFARAFFEANP